MSLNIHFYPHDIDAWRRKTCALTMQEKGIYREVLDALYFLDGRLPADIRQLGRIVGVQTRSEKKSLEKVVATFLQKECAFFVQKRVVEELRKIHERSSKATTSALCKYIKNKEIGSANAERTQSERCTERTSERSASYKLIVTNTASSVPTSAREAGQADKKIFQEVEVNAAKRGDDGWLPELSDSEILPGGWSDIAEELSIPDEQIYKSFRKFKDVSTKPYQLVKWRGWIKREHGAKQVNEAAK